MVYPQLLNAEFDRLPDALRRLHGRNGRTQAAGTVTFRREPGLFPRIVGFPPSGRVPVQLEIIAEEHREIWIRRFGNSVHRSVQQAQGGLMVEAAGPLRLYFRVFALESEIRIVLERARLLGIPLPLYVEAAERASESGWEFEVSVAHVGSYRGRMELIA